MIASYLEFHARILRRIGTIRGVEPSTGLFFITATGMMGMSPPASKAKDQICMLFGGEVPFVLRPIGLSFQLIGDAYVRVEGRPCNGRTWRDAAESAAPADDTAGKDLGLAFALTRMAEKVLGSVSFESEWPYPSNRRILMVPQ